MNGLIKAAQMWQKGAIDTGEVDRNGRKIEQFDLVEHDGERFLILYGAIQDDFIGMHEDGFWLVKEAFKEAVIVEKGWGLKKESDAATSDK